MSDKDLFIAFLKKHKALTAFKRNLKQDRDKILTDWLIICTNPERYIGSAFHWGTTPEGTMYWYDLNEKWHSYYTAMRP